MPKGDEEDIIDGFLNEIDENARGCNNADWNENSNGSGDGERVLEKL